MWLVSNMRSTIPAWNTSSDISTGSKDRESPHRLEPQAQAEDALGPNAQTHQRIASVRRLADGGALLDAQADHWARWRRYAGAERSGYNSAP